MNPGLRIASQNDRDWVGDVWRSCPELGKFAITWHWHFHEKQVVSRTGATRYSVGYVNPSQWAVTAEGPFGFIHYRLRQDGYTVVYEIAVDPGSRGRGYGRLLLSAAGCPVRLTTSNQAAAAFYTRLGFKNVGTTPRNLQLFELT